MQKIRIGTRSSPLALWQTEYIAGLIKANHPEIIIDIIHIKTKGDKILDVALSKIGDKGLFTKELEIEILNNNIDIAVHSLKDLPTVLPDGLEISAFSKRHDARDVLIAKNKGDALLSLRKNAVVATGSLRRRSQILNLRNDIISPDLRGNLQTRINKLKENNWDGIILAAAGVERMEMQHLISSYFSYDEMLPAVGQGVIAIESAIENNSIHKLIESINNKETEYAVKAERAMLKELGGGCQTPMGSYAEVKNDLLHIRGFVGTIDGSRLIRAEQTGDFSYAEKIGKDLAKTLIEDGAGDIINSYL